METRLFANWVTGDKQGRHGGQGRARQASRGAPASSRYSEALAEISPSQCIIFSLHPLYLFLHFNLFIVVGVHEPQCAGRSHRTIYGHWFSTSTTGVVGNELGSSGLAAGATEQSHWISLLYYPVFFSHAHPLVFLPCFFSPRSTLLCGQLLIDFYLPASMRGEAFLP